MHELDPDRVAVERFQARHRRVIVELASLLRPRDQRGRTFEQTIERLQPERAYLRIEHALPRIDVVGSRQFAPAALERRILVEIGARLDAQRPRQAVRRDIRQGLGRVGNDRVGPLENVVGVQRIENRAFDVRGIDIVRGLRIKSGLGDRERDAQDLGGVGLRSDRRRTQRCAERQRNDGNGTPHHNAFSMSPAIDSGVSFGA